MLQVQAPVVGGGGHPGVFMWLDHHPDPVPAAAPVIAEREGLPKAYQRRLAKTDTGAGTGAGAGAGEGVVTGGAVRAQDFQLHIQAAHSGRGQCFSFRQNNDRVELAHRQKNHIYPIPGVPNCFYMISADIPSHELGLSTDIHNRLSENEFTKEGDRGAEKFVVRPHSNYRLYCTAVPFELDGRVCRLYIGDVCDTHNGRGGAKPGSLAVKHYTINPVLEPEGPAPF